MSDVAGLVLAAGASTRMGRNKMLIELDGEALVRRAARLALDAGLHPVVLVIGDEPDDVRRAVADLPILDVRNPDRATETGASLRIGLDALDARIDAVVVLLGDMVATTPPMVRTLVERHQQSGAVVVASRYQGVVAPPVLFSRQVFGALREASGARIGQQVAASGAGLVEFVDWPPEHLQDVDTPEDLQAVRHSSSRSGAS